MAGRGGLRSWAVRAKARPLLEWLWWMNLYEFDACDWRLYAFFCLVYYLSCTSFLLFWGGFFFDWCTYKPLFCVEFGFGLFCILLLFFSAACCKRGVFFPHFLSIVHALLFLFYVLSTDSRCITGVVWTSKSKSLYHYIYFCSSMGGRGWHGT